jgi:acetyl-CoA acyltransferase
VARLELARRKIDPASVFDYGVLGFSVPQKHSFYGLPWLTGMIGASQAGGPTLMQACATGVRTLLAAAQEIEVGMATVALAINCDRTSNGPHLYYPNPRGPGGTGLAEDWVMDNFNCDPLGGHAMLQTAENVARKHGIGTAEQHELVLRREEQYRMSLENDSAFLKRFMTLPFEVPAPELQEDSRDHGRRRRLFAIDGGGPGQAEARHARRQRHLRRPDPPGRWQCRHHRHHGGKGAGAFHRQEDRRAPARLRPGPRELAYMPEATVPAAQRALDRAGKKIAEMKAIKTHNPFAVNDLYFARQTGCDLKPMNNYGCSLVWGHPQAPMGTRAIIELIEELVLKGGGFGLFTGCAAGDTAMSVVLEVCDA